MHILEEQGAEHVHSHEHTHADGTTHNHPHTHEHDHEHAAEHTHEHTHPDGTTHSHPHTHEHGEEHYPGQAAPHNHTHEGETHSHPHTHADGTAHTHPHTHEHGEGHEHVHDHEVPADLAKVKAIMKYMVEHNEHHADELADLLGMLPEDAKAKLTRAIGTFEAANVELRGVLETLEKQ